ncbi:hypothetical protein COB55_03665 [Candidatus Wolfebacteria bacterium]|nr:MAG: hypothetical protein COB55_03665 [Candidatus Wolfebacteria bacterium]
MTEKCKKEIEEYVESQKWNNVTIFDHFNLIYPSYFYYSSKGEKRKLHELWLHDEHKMNKHMLEFFGHILKKHNITKVDVHKLDCKPGNIIEYTSKDWKFDTIFRTLEI